MTYNYYEAVENDIREYLEGMEIADLDRDTLFDELFVADSVTGNASGSYTFSTYEAEENLCHNLDLLSEALEEFGCDVTYLTRGAEACDVTIRCYLLGQVLDEVLEDLRGE